jgi:hypothetical protein
MALMRPHPQTASGEANSATILNPESRHPAHVVAEVHVVADKFRAMNDGRIVRQLNPLENVPGRQVMMEEGVEIGIRRPDALAVLAPAHAVGAVARHRPRSLDLPAVLVDPENLASGRAGID